jgi:hypothetical protein
MKHYKLDRRKAEQYSVFPLMDDKGQEVRKERRSGVERRKNERNIEVASQILSVLH